MRFLISLYLFLLATILASGQNITNVFSGQIISSGSIFSTIPSSSGPANLLLSNIAVYYKLDETSGTRADSTTNNMSVTNVTALGTVSYTNAVINNGAFFTGASALKGSITNLLNTGDFSAAFWLYTRAGDNTYYFQVVDNPVVNSVFAMNQVSSTIMAPTIKNTVMSCKPIPTNTWTHIALVYTNQNLFYFSNSVYITNALILRPVTVNNFLTLGSQWNNATSTKANLDEFGLWNRALTQSEITWLANSNQFSTFTK